MTDRKKRIKDYIRSRIRDARLSKDIPQNELANAIGKSNVSVSDIERGKVGVSVVDLALIADYLNKPIQYFIPRVGSLHDKVSYEYRITAILDDEQEHTLDGKSSLSFDSEDYFDVGIAYSNALEITMSHFYTFAVEKAGFWNIESVNVEIFNMQYQEATL